MLPAPGTPIELTYKLHWFLDQVHPPAGIVIATRQGRSRTFEPDLQLFVIDFAGGGLEQEKADTGIVPKVTVGAGAALVHLNLQKNPYNDTWRVLLALRPDGSGRPVELT